jgi:predicted RNase H-like HicB family nuclease
MSWEGKVEEVVKTYHVTYKRDELGWWVASVRGLRGCHTQGRTVDEARRRLVEAMELFVDNTRSAKIVDDVTLLVAAKKAIRACATLRKRAEQHDRPSHPNSASPAEDVTECRSDRVTIAVALQPY